MKLITDIVGESKHLKASSVATIGFFDGVHKGHRFLLERVCEIAKARSLSSMAITFPLHPRMVMQSDYVPRLLTTFEEKCRLLSTTGIDTCVALSFTQELAILSAYEFMRQILRDCLHIKVLLVGYDHRFGHNRSEGFEDYVRYGEELGIEVLQAVPFSLDDVQISSSVVRNLLTKGEVRMASECLGYNYFMSGTVVGGHQIGRTLGFPTANLQMEDSLKLIPKDGVYAVHVRCEEKQYQGMLNIGCRPTIDEDDSRTIEVHLLQFDGNLYNKKLRMDFVERIRGEEKFLNRDALVHQLTLDADASIKIFEVEKKAQL